MRGQMKPSTRFSKFRNEVIVKFDDDTSMLTDFMSHIRNVIVDVEAMISTYGFEDFKHLNFNKPSPATAVYSVLRLIDRPVLLRDLEVVVEQFWQPHGKQTLYSALFVLVSLNLIDYKFRNFNSTPSNVIQFFLKDED